jgi:hypothetical protein
MGGRFEDLKGRLLDAMDGLRNRGRGARTWARSLRGRRPNLDGVRDRLHDNTRGWQGRRPHLPAIALAIDDVRERLRERDGWIAATLLRMRPWHAVPAFVAALALIVGGFWLGGMVGGHANAAVLTSTVKLKGHVITIDGNRFISTPAVTVKVKGKTVHIPARTVRLPASTVVKGKTVPVKVDVNRTVSVPVTVSVKTTNTQTTTLHSTVTTVRTVVRTVTGPTTTVNGPPITITLPGPTVTVTVTT